MFSLEWLFRYSATNYIYILLGMEMCHIIILVWQIVKIDMILFTVTQKTCYFTNLALEGVHESASL